MKLPSSNIGEQILPNYRLKFGEMTLFVEKCAKILENLR